MQPIILSYHFHGRGNLTISFLQQEQLFPTFDIKIKLVELDYEYFCTGKYLESDVLMESQLHRILKMQNPSHHFMSSQVDDSDF